MGPPDTHPSTTEMLQLVQHACAQRSSAAAAVAALVCLLGLLAMVCVAQTAYMLRLRPVLARCIREGRHDSDAYSRGRSLRRRRRDESYLSRRSAGSFRWSRSYYNTDPNDGDGDGLWAASGDGGLWAARGGSSPARSSSREDSRYERMRGHRAVEGAERGRLGSGRPPSFFRTPATYYGSVNSGRLPAPLAPPEGRSGWAEARPRARRVVSFPNLNELRNWGATCEAKGYVYDGVARGYVQPVCPEGFTLDDPRYPARTIWAADLIHLDRCAQADDAYVARNS